MQITVTWESIVCLLGNAVVCMGGLLAISLLCYWAVRLSGAMIYSAARRFSSDRMKAAKVARWRAFYSHFHSDEECGGEAYPKDLAVQQAMRVLQQQAEEMEARQEAVARPGRAAHE